MTDIQSQIDYLRISGSVLPMGVCEEVADTMEKMLAVVEAARGVRKQMCRNNVAYPEDQDLLDALDALVLGRRTP